MTDKVNNINDYAGNWQNLDNEIEVKRYIAISFIIGFGHGKRILDVGCGTGELQKYIAGQESYTGIEVSEIALKIAIANNDNNKNNFIRLSAEEFKSRTKQYDIIIFNEMLYYTRDPVFLIAKYKRYLSDNGVIVCSVYYKNDNFKLAIKKFLTKKKYASNKSCAELVLNYMINNRWHILEDIFLRIDDTDKFWRIWMAKPTVLRGQLER